MYFDDILAALDKPLAMVGAPQESRVDIDPDWPDFKIDFGEIPAVIDESRGLRYPHDSPADPCP